MHLDQTQAFKRLSEKQEPRIIKELCKNRRWIIEHEQLSFNYTYTQLTDSDRDILKDLSKEQRLIEKLHELKNGAILNIVENKAIHHYRTRSLNDTFFKNQFDRIKKFIDEQFSNKHISDVVQIGIGGSHLGPDAIFKALRSHYPTQVSVHFLANIDPLNLTQIMSRINFRSTLFIFASKSGTTLETIENLKAFQAIAQSYGLSQSGFKSQCISITKKDAWLDDKTLFSKIFYITDEIGGRFSVTSAVGITLLSLAFGWPIIDEFLLGAHEMDCLSENDDPLKNAPLMAALISIFERNILDLSSRAITPYSYPLSRFIAHIQQLECESNGKQVSQDGTLIHYKTAPVIFGEAGTNCQHSFFQMLHQGSDTIPVQFISTKTNSKLLMANMDGQIQALAFGNSESNPFSHCSGNKPSTSIILKDLSARSIGNLLSFYENMIVFEGFLWDINSFDQEGVTLGKKITQDILKES
jgi:glucose-6-phosphate isomerase